MPMRPITRIQPVLPVQAMKTYTVLAPIDQHFRTATCREFECSGFRLGWRTVIDESTPLGQRQAAYIKAKSGRAFREMREAGITVFLFPPGQECFQEHRIRLDRDPFYLVRGGDWRRHLGLERRHINAEDFVDDFRNHQDAIASAQQKG